jgi:WD40 repeat protein
MLVGHTEEVQGVLELRDGRILSWSTADETLRLWTASGEAAGPPLTGHTGVWGALELRDGRILSWSLYNTLRLWTASGDPAGPPLTGHTESVKGALELRDGRILSWGSSWDSGGTLRLCGKSGSAETIIRLDAGIRIVAETDNGVRVIAQRFNRILIYDLACADK